MCARFSRSLELNKTDFKKIYAARHYLGSKIRERAGLKIPFDVYFQDPQVAKENEELGIDGKCLVEWEPGIADGPTSARFAVVDYNADAGTLAAPAKWDETNHRFVHDGQVIDRSVLEDGTTDLPQFHQVNVWAILQRALGFFEEPNGLGRRIPWGFEGNRLIVVPHAGYGENAYYDRQSKSLQFYYFDKADTGQVQTCLSTDIVHHEFGHAVLDGVRPHLNESVSIETAAFHEFIGDLTAILLILRNNEFRKLLLRENEDDVTDLGRIAGIAEEFGSETKDRPYLRTALNDLTVASVEGSSSPHEMSQVMTGAMFDILQKLAEHYLTERKRSPGQALWDSIARMQRMAVQPLDFLPPNDVTFRDYALAVLRSEELRDARDPHGYRQMMVQVFVDRGILGEEETEELTAGGYLHDRLDLSIYHGADQIGASKANAYRFLDDNRDKLGLPPDRDIVVTDLYHAEKYARQARRLPRQLIVEYVWRQDVLLEGERFGRFAGQWTAMLCGGTMVFDENGTVLWWARKEGSETGDDAGAARLEEFLDNLARRIKAGQIGSALGGEKGLLGTRLAPFTERTVDGTLRIELTPHLNLSEDHDEKGGDRQWQISS